MFHLVALGNKLHAFSRFLFAHELSSSNLWLLHQIITLWVWNRVNEHPRNYWFFQSLLCPCFIIRYGVRAFLPTRKRNISLHFVLNHKLHLIVPQFPHFTKLFVFIRIAITYKILYKNNIIRICVMMRKWKKYDVSPTFVRGFLRKET